MTINNNNGATCMARPAAPLPGGAGGCTPTCRTNTVVNMKAIFVRVDNNATTEEFDIDSNPYHENDIVDLETTYIKKELDQYSRDIINNIKHDISLTGLFQIVAIRHETIVETVISTYHHHNRIAIMIKPYNPNSK